MGFSEYLRYDGIGLAEVVETRDVQPVELVDEAIGRAEAVNPKLNAVIYKDYERAREAARAPLPAGPFRGVPFFLKDVLVRQGDANPAGGRVHPAVSLGSRFTFHRP